MSTRKGNVKFLDDILVEVGDFMHDVMRQNEAKYKQVSSSQHCQHQRSLTAVCKSASSTPNPTPSRSSYLRRPLLRRVKPWRFSLSSLSARPTSSHWSIPYSQSAVHRQAILIRTRTAALVLHRLHHLFLLFPCHSAMHLHQRVTQALF